MLFSNIFNRKTVVTVDLDTNVRLTVTPTVGGAYATIVENGDIFTRSEKAFFGNR